MVCIEIMTLMGPVSESLDAAINILEEKGVSWKQTIVDRNTLLQETSAVPRSAALIIFGSLALSPCEVVKMKEEDLNELLGLLRYPLRS